LLSLSITIPIMEIISNHTVLYSFFLDIKKAGERASLFRYDSGISISIVTQMPFGNWGSFTPAPLH
ncbi:hypothetical protein V7114_11390, partial [Neobacillus niacini]|uniref:hypothetical protein n=1 Tax=Neobacillus niacini TaxID=86668 RepID=UPI0030009E24